MKNILFLLIIIVPSLRVTAQELHLRVMLEGPSEKILTNNVLMQTPPTNQLRSYGMAVPEGSVDQVSVLLLDPQTGIVRHSQNGWLRKDGQVMNLSGNQIYLTAPVGTYQVLLKHRNHLPIVTEQPITIDGQTVLDFTKPDVPKKGSFSLHLNGQAMMTAGNVYDEPNVQYSEVNAADVANVCASITDKVPDFLVNEDLNLDGKVDDQDRLIAESHSLILSFTTAENK